MLGFAATVLLTMAAQAAIADSLSGFLELPGPVPAPKTAFVDERATPVTIQSFHGKTLVINFWATWCAPCVKEMPSLSRLKARLPSEKFAIIAISQDKGGAAVARPFLDRLGITNFQAYSDPQGRLSRDFGIRGLPTTVVVSGSGLVKGRWEGAIEWDAQEVVDKLMTIAAGP